MAALASFKMQGAGIAAANCSRVICTTSCCVFAGGSISPLKGFCGARSEAQEERSRGEAVGILACMLQHGRLLIC